MYGSVRGQVGRRCVYQAYACVRLEEEAEILGISSIMYVTIQQSCRFLRTIVSQRPQEKNKLDLSCVHVCVR